MWTQAGEWAAAWSRSHHTVHMHPVCPACYFKLTFWYFELCWKQTDLGGRPTRWALNHSCITYKIQMHTNAYKNICTTKYNFHPTGCFSILWFVLTSLNIHSWVWLWSCKSNMGHVHLRHNAVWSNTSLLCNSVFYMYSYYTMFHMLCQRDTILPRIHFSGRLLIFLAGNVWHRRSQTSPSQLQALLHSTEPNIVICCVCI